MKMYRMFTGTILGLSVILAGTMTASAQDSVLYATDGRECTPSTLYQLDPVDGSIISTIGSTGISGLTSLASHPLTSVMYGITTGGGDCDNSLYTVDLDTGAATLVGPLGAPGGKPDAAFRSDGVLFTYATGDYFLYTVDLTTGAATLVGDTGVSAWDISLTFDGGTLVMTDGDTVYTVDTGTGAATSGPGLGISVNDSNMSTTDLATGQVYLGDSDNSARFDLYTLDAPTGDMVLLGGNTIYQMSAIEFYAGGGSGDAEPVAPIPTLSQWSLLLLVLGLGIFGIRRLSSRISQE